MIGRVIMIDHAYRPTDIFGAARERTEDEQMLGPVPVTVTPPALRPSPSGPAEADG
jgi:hypothetical protein